MFIDLHAHTSGISYCCRLTAREVLSTAKEFGYDGLVITNHYTSDYYSNESYSAWIEKYIDEFNLCEKIAEELSLKVFFGAEITMDYDTRVHLLIYGVTPEFLRNNPKLCSMTQEALYEVCRDNNCALVNAHPYRFGSTVQNTKYLDGIEINCHPLHGDIRLLDLENIAKNNGLAITCGCDYHGDSYRPQGGAILPESIDSNEDIVNYILRSSFFELQVQEPNDENVVTKNYSINRR